MAWRVSIGRLDWSGGFPWRQGSVGGSRVEVRRTERERHHWILRGDGRQAVVAGTNVVSTSRARSICVIVAK